MARLNPFRRRPQAAAPTRRARSSTAHGASLVASGRAIDISDRKQLDRYRRRLNSNAWQGDAWLYDDLVPILGFGHDVVRDSLARVRPFPAIKSDDPDEPPVPITKETAPKGLDWELCDEIVSRLEPFPTFMGQSARKIDVAGEAHVVLIEDKEVPSGERCLVLSNDELFTVGDEWRMRQAPDDAFGTPIPAGSPLWRLWTPSSRFGDLPYSHMIRLNLACEQLLLLNRLIKAVAQSRLATTGQIIAVAEEFSLETSTAGESPTGDAGDGEVGSDTFMDDFISIGAMAMLDPESAAAVMPMIVRGPHALIKDGIQVIDIYRKMEDTLMKLRQEAREEIATGMNLPREILLGVGSTNHWNADEITTQMWQTHLEPRAIAIMAGTTEGFFRPSLLSNKVDPDIVKRCMLWYDPKWFIGSPDLAESADSGLEHMAISLDAWRTAKGYSPDDAPSDKEIQMRLGWKQQEQVRTTRREDVAGPDSEVVPVEGAPVAKAIAPPAKQEGADQTVKAPDAKDTSAPPEGTDAAAKGTTKKAKKPVVAAAGSDHAMTGVMLALMIPPAEARVLSDLMGDKGEDPNLVHITLAFLGDEADLDDLQRSALVQIARDVTAAHSPLDGMTTPGATELGEDRAIVTKPYVPGIHALHHDLVAACEAAGLPVRTEYAYANYVPHITLGYLSSDEEAPDVEVPTLPLHFDAVTIRIAMQDIKCPFGTSNVRGPMVAAGRQLLADLGHRHVAIERDLRTRLQQIAESLLARALEKAGMRVKTKASSGQGRRSPAVAAMFEGRQSCEIPSVLGADAVLALGLEDQHLLEGALGDLQGRYKLLVRRAQHAAAQAAAQAAGTDYDPDELDQRMDPHIDAGWTVLSAGLMGLALHLLYNPHPDAPAVGEFDESSLVPPGLVRAALSVAGGAAEGDTTVVRGAEIPQPSTPIVADTDPAVVGGATAGPAMLDDFYDQMGITSDEMIWLYGEAPRSRPFAPHQDLDGITFTGWDDPALLNAGDFPDYEHLFPGDHRGCECDAARTYTQAGETTVLEPGLGIDTESDRLTRTEEADARDAPRRQRGASHERVSLIVEDRDPVDWALLEPAGALWMAQREAVQEAADGYGRGEPPIGAAAIAARVLIAAMGDPTRQLKVTDPLYRLVPDPDGTLGAWFTAGTRVSFALAPFDRADRRILEPPTVPQLVLTTTGPVHGLGLAGEIVIGGQFDVVSAVDAGARRIVTLAQTATPVVFADWTEDLHPRDNHGRFGDKGDGSSDGGAPRGSAENPIKVGADLDKAAVYLAAGKHVELDQPDQVSSLLDKLAGIAKDAEARGDKAPNYNLCSISVPGTNLFCNDSIGVPRIEMPQFSGTPVAGSPADALTRDKRGEVNASEQFVQALTSSGVKVAQEDVLASHLRASQNELVGAKVAGMMQAYSAGTLPPGSIFVTRDNYVLDGHHRWAAVIGTDAKDGHLGDLRMPVQKLDMDIGAALDFANRWTKEYGIAPKGA